MRKAFVRHDRNDIPRRRLHTFLFPGPKTRTEKGWGRGLLETGLVGRCDRFQNDGKSLIDQSTNRISQDCRQSRRSRVPGAPCMPRARDVRIKLVFFFYPTSRRRLCYWFPILRRVYTFLCDRGDRLHYILYTCILQRLETVHT